MALYGTNVEYGLHCLLFLVGLPDDVHASSQELAEMQGVSPSFVAKLFTALKRARLVVATEGAQGGFRLARPAADITVLDVVHALEGDKPLFRCREIRRHCALFDGTPPAWATDGRCSIHAVMLEAETRMKEVLAGHTLATLAARVGRKAPRTFATEVVTWFGDRHASRVRRSPHQHSKGNRG